MRDMVVNIEEPTFIFTLRDYPKTFTVDELAPEPVQFAAVPSADVVMQPVVEEVTSNEEIMLIRAAAEAALNDSR